MSDEKLGQCLAYSSAEMRIAQMKIEELQKEISDLREALESIATLDTTNPFVAPCMALLAQQALQRAGGGE